MYYQGQFSRCDISIENGTIVSVEKDICGDDEFDASGFIIIPGFVNTHAHNAMTLLRGAGDDMPLQTWLSERIWPLEANLTAKDCYWGNMLGIAEMLKTGTTCFNDMYFFLEAGIDAINDSGIRASLGYGVLNFGDGQKAVTEMKAAKKYHAMCSSHERITYMMAPHAPYSCSKDLLCEIKDYARGKGIKTHIHVSETEKEVSDSMDAYGMSPVKYLDSFDFLDSSTILAHCVHVSDEDIGILSKRGCSVLHCPHSNLKLSSGIAPVPAMLDAHVNVALGTDGASSNNTLDMHAEMKTMALIHKLSDPTRVPASTALSIATENGGRALGLPIGVIGKGYKADLVFVDANHHSMTPSHNIVSNMVYSLTPDAVAHVMVDGRFVVVDGKLVTMDEELVKRKAQEHALSLVERAG